MSHEPETVGPYRVLSMLGSGGWGTVYRCTGPDGEEAAVKVLQSRRDQPEHLQRFEREARIRIEHPNVIRVLDAGTEANGSRWIAFELLHGRTLAQRLREGPMNAANAIKLITAAAAGVTAAHGRGIIHRDLKPENIFLCEDGTVKVLDFGVARWAEENVDLTIDQVVVGTPAYLSPEQARAKRDVDERSDVWSLGVILYECLSGRRPFRGESPLATMLSITLDDPVPITQAAPGIPSQLGPIVARALSKAERERYPAVASLAKALGAVDLTIRSTETVDFISLDDDTSQTGDITSPSREHRLVALLYLRGVRSGRRARRVVEELGGMFVPLWGRDGVGVFGTTGWEGDEPDRALAAALRLSRAAIKRAVTVGRIPAGGRTISGPVLQALQDNADVESPEVIIDAESARLLKDDYALMEIAPGKLLAEPLESSRSSIPSVEGLIRPLVGRDVERATVDRVIRQVDETSSAALVLVIGPSGIGKTRLREEAEMIFSQRLPGAEVFSARASSGKRSRAYAPLADAIRGALVSRAHMGTDTIDDVAPELAGLEALLPHPEARATVNSGLRALLGLASPDGATLPPPAGADAAANRDRRTVLEFFGAVAAHRPLLISLDDAQWADHETLEVLEALLDHLEDVPFLLLLTARPQLDEAPPDLISGAPRLVRIEPQPLLASDVEELGRLILGRQVPPTLLEKLVERCGGNPLFLDETLNAIRGMSPERMSDDLPVPVSVEAAVQARLDGLPAEDRQTCRALSVVRSGLSLEELGKLGIPDAKGRVQALVRKRILARKARTEGARFRFRVPVVGEIAYQSLGDDERRDLHRRAADVLVNREGVDPEELASHFERGGAIAEAALHCAVAARAASSRGDARTAMRCADAAMVLGVRDEDHFVMLTIRARAWASLGIASRALRDLDAAEPLAPEGRARTEVSAMRADVLAAKGALGEALLAAERALQLATDDDDDELVARASLRRASIQIDAGDAENANQDIEEAFARAAAFPGLRGEALMVDGQLALGRCNPYRAQEAFAAAAVSFRDVGDASRALGAENEVATIWRALGRAEEAAALLEGVVQGARLSGPERIRGHALLNLSRAQLALGNLQYADNAAEEAYGEGKRLGDAELRALSLCCRARVNLRRGEVDEALSLAREATAVAEGDQPWSFENHAVIAAIQLQRGRAAKAAAWAERALADEAQSSADAGVIAECHTRLEEVFRAADDAPRADTLAGRRVAWRSAVDGAITDDEWRERFAASIPVR